MQPIQIAIAAALDDEIRPIISRVEVDARVSIRSSSITVGRLGRHTILVARSGVGRDAMTQVVEESLKHYLPNIYINLGYCGAADPDLSAGDIVISHQAVDAESSDVIRSDRSLVDKAMEVCKAGDLRSSIGSFVTVDEAIHSPHEKAFLGTKHGVRAIDMESYAFLGACARKNIGALIVRAVLDPLEMTLPDLGDAIDSAGKTDPVGFASHIIRKPKDMLMLPRIAQNAATCRTVLSKFVDGWLAS